MEKILRVQPDVKKLFLQVLAPDVESAKLRIQTEVKSLVVASVFSATCLVTPSRLDFHRHFVLDNAILA